jgi:hypothetical protein
MDKKIDIVVKDKLLEIEPDISRMEMDWNQFRLMTKPVHLSSLEKLRQFLANRLNSSILLFVVGISTIAMMFLFVKEQNNLPTVPINEMNKVQTTINNQHSNFAPTTLDTIYKNEDAKIEIPSRVIMLPQEYSDTLLKNRKNDNGSIENLPIDSILGKQNLDKRNFSSGSLKTVRNFVIKSDNKTQVAPPVDTIDIIW